jgi:tRNA-binding EMAP/Myf-like protein
LKHEKESKELEIKKLELQKKENNLKIMCSIANHYKKEIEEKIEFYHNNIVQPLDHK